VDVDRRFARAVGEDFGQAEHPDDDGHEAHPVEQAVDTEGEPRRSGHGVNTDHRDQQAQCTGNQGPDHRAAGQRDQQRDAHDHQGEEFGRTDEQSRLAQRLGGCDQAHRGHAAADKRSDGRDGQGSTGPAEFGHGIAVQRRNGRRGLPRRIQQNARDRAAVTGAVKDGAEHDD
jgi:hypothetical protein